MTRLAEQLDSATSAACDREGHRPGGPLRRLGAFVQDVLAPLYAGHVTGGGAGHCCPRWWEHDEAVVRLDAVWRAWAAHRIL